MSELFAPSDVQWKPVSPKLATARRLVGCPLPLLGAIALAVVALLPDVEGTAAAAAWAGAALALIIAAAIFVWAGRNQRRWGYAEREDDLLVTHGILFRRSVAVPYGRMQFVDVQAGPVARMFGFASVSLHTASQATAATVPGLPTDEARRLRNRLTELGEAHGAGL